MAHKLDKAVVLYFPPEQVGTDEGTHCSACMMFVRDHCTVVDGKIDGDNGVCGLYVFGTHLGPDMHGMIPKEIAGYITNAPSHCGNCKNYRGDENSGSCKVVEGEVEYHGCCNAWEEAQHRDDDNPYDIENRTMERNRK